MDFFTNKPIFAHLLVVHSNIHYETGNKLYFNKLCDPAGFLKGFKTTDHHLAINTLIEKYIQYNRPLNLHNSKMSAIMTDLEI